MSFLSIGFKDDRRQFTPTEWIFGTVRWQLDKPETLLELRLFWHTSGKGDTDVNVVDTLKWNSPVQQGEEAFQFQLPEAPYSFSGKLISLIWSLELVATANREDVKEDLVMSPSAAEIILSQVHGSNGS